MLLYFLLSVFLNPKFQISQRVHKRLLNTRDRLRRIIQDTANSFLFESFCVTFIGKTQSQQSRSL